MGKRIINIDGYIGEGGYSAQYVRNAMAGAQDDEVEVRINSLGGDVGQALAIKDQFAAHGNVAAVYSGASASSATLISMGCKKITMTKDSFFLVHKPMMYVDAWGAMNEDEIQNLIDNLSSSLENAQRWTLQMAKIYSEKTGGTVKEMLALMKKAAWMTAVEAKKAGFIDEIITADKMEGWAGDEKLVAMIAGNDLPPLPRVQTATAAAEPENNDLVKQINEAGDSFLEKMKNFFTSHTNKNPEMKKEVFALVCAALAVDALEMQDNGVFLNKEQLDKIEAEMKKLQDGKTTAEASMNTAVTEKTTAVNALTAANAALDELDTTVKAAEGIDKKVEAVRKKLAEKPGAAATGAQGSGDNTRKKIEGADEVTAYAQKLV